MSLDLLVSSFYQVTHFWMTRVSYAHTRVSVPMSLDIGGFTRYLLSLRSSIFSPHHPLHFYLHLSQELHDRYDLRF